MIGSVHLRLPTAHNVDYEYTGVKNSWILVGVNHLAH